MPEPTNQPRNEIADLRGFGRAIARLRESKGLEQKEVAARVGTYYSETSSYRRIELGGRKAPREAAIAILRQGLELDSAEDINGLLALLGYAPLTATEASGLPDLAAKTITQEVIEAPSGFSFHVLRASRSKIALAVITAISLGLTCILAQAVEYGSGFVIVSSLLYASLYPVSLFLESAYEPGDRRLDGFAVLSFAIMSLSSVAALGMDSLILSKSADALLCTLGVFGLSAAGQWLFSRAVLSDRAVVEARFQTHPAQAAHLKNTLYFLIIVVFFWVPPLHYVFSLHRLGKAGPIHPIAGQRILVGSGIVSLDPVALIGLLLALMVASLAMRGQLLDNLKPSRYLNRYVSLFYLRAGLFFGLCILCIWWYAHALETLRS